MANLPKPGKGGYTYSQVSRALAAVRVSEIEKADCLHDLVDFTEGSLGVVRGD